MARPSATDVVTGLDLRGKTVVITGATSGLGRESARALAGVGAHIVLAARNAAALRETQDWLGVHAPDAQTTAVRLDLASLAGIRSAAVQIAVVAPAIDVLMNNAGVMFTPFEPTADGFETQFGTNHLGHFALTELLTPQLIAAQGARVVNLSSDGHFICDVDLDDPNWEHRRYDKFQAYGASKTANILHAFELDRRLRDHGVRAFAVHPGMVATALARHMGRDDFAKLGDLKPAHTAERSTDIDVRHDVVTPELGAATQVWAATTTELADRGAFYLADCAIRTDIAAYADDAGHAAALWALSESLVAANRG